MNCSAEACPLEGARSSMSSSVTAKSVKEEEKKGENSSGLNCSFVCLQAGVLFSLTLTN